MRTLYFLRHAEAENNYQIEDKDRALTERGYMQAKQIAPYLPKIQLAFCSPAKRTKTTLVELEKNGANILNRDFDGTLYNASQDTLLKMIQNCHEEQSILIVGHNPGIHLLTNNLTTNDDSNLKEELIAAYHPATLSVIECDIERWSDLKLAQNRIRNLITSH